MRAEGSKRKKCRGKERGSEKGGGGIEEKIEEKGKNKTKKDPVNLGKRSGIVFWHM